MNKILKIILATLGACSVLIDIMTPLAVALIWGELFQLNATLDVIILVVGGLASFFRAIKLWFVKE